MVVIDPGHGGTENMPGSSANNAVSTSGVLEKTMTLSYGLQLRDTLNQKAKAQKKNIHVLMTRTTDKNLGGTERANKARDNGADDFFIIHFNSDDGHTARGTLAVVRASNDNVNLNEDNSFITPVVQGVVNAMKSYDSAANVRTPVPKDTNASNDINLGNTADYHLVRFGYIEVEFIDTPAVDALLNTGPNAGAVQGAIINAMADGILNDLNTQPAQP